MCLFCGSSDPLHGIGPVQLMLAGTAAYGAYVRIGRPLRERLRRKQNGLPAQSAYAAGSVRNILRPDGTQKQ